MLKLKIADLVLAAITITSVTGRAGGTTDPEPRAAGGTRGCGGLHLSRLEAALNF